jgi:hypothetical protein
MNARLRGTLRGNDASMATRVFAWKPGGAHKQIKFGKSQTARGFNDLALEELLSYSTDRDESAA